MKELIIETVANGFVVCGKRVFSTHPADKPALEEIYVFSNPAQLTAWMEKWSVERAKEYKAQEKKSA
jgi:hypothetical protein